MHMNAVPRGFWNGFGSFALPRRAHLPSQISQEMAANVTNAWSSQRYMTESVLVNQGWDQSLNEADDTNHSENFLSNVYAQPYADAPPCIHFTAGSQYEAHTYRPSSFYSNMSFLTGDHQAQTMYNVSGYYQRPLGSQISFEPFQYGAPHVLGGATPGIATTLNDDGIWHDAHHQSNIINPTDVVRHVDCASFLGNNLRNWSAQYGSGSRVLNPGTQHSTVSPQRLAIHIVSSPALSHSDSIGFWTPVPSPINSSPDVPGPFPTAESSSLEDLSFGIPCTQQENDHKTAPSTRKIRPGEELRSLAASIPSGSTVPGGDWNNQSHKSPPEENTESKRSLRRVTPTSQKISSTSASRGAQDDFLLRARENGMSYKEIRRRGNFSEAESTLRGRLRALKKKPCERVRKPEWTQKDDDLLMEKVTDLSEHNWSLRSQAPWRQVSEHIWNNGGSYKFGYATCRKRWEDLNVPSDD